MASQRPIRLFRNMTAKIAAIPMILTAMVVFVGGTVWTIVYSFTNSKLLPKTQWVGFDQYERLWNTNRWIVSIENLAIYGIGMLILSFVIGFLLVTQLQLLGSSNPGALVKGSLAAPGNHSRPCRETSFSSRLSPA